MNKVLTSDTEDRWDKAYNNTSSILCDNPRKYHILKSKYQRLTYYARYCLRKIEEILNPEVQHLLTKTIHQQWNILVKKIVGKYWNKLTR